MGYMIGLTLFVGVVIANYSENKVKSYIAYYLIIVRTRLSYEWIPSFCLIKIQFGYRLFVIDS